VSPTSHSWEKPYRAIFHRPAVFALCFLIAGIITHSWFPGIFLPGAALVVGVIALVCHFVPLHPIVRWMPVGILFLIFGAWRVDQTFLAQDDSIIDQLQKQVLPITVSGTIVRDPLEYLGGTTVILDDATVQGIDSWIPLRGKLSLKLDEPNTTLQYNDRMQIWGHLTRPERRRNPGGVDWRTLYRRAGIVARLHPQSSSDFEIIGTAGKSPVLTGVAYPLRRQILEQIRRWFPERSQALISALLVGERERLDPDFTEATRRSGIAHLLVISGFHVGIIALFLMGFFALLRLPFPLRIILTLVGIILFAMIAEWRPPVLRATIMALIIGCSYLFRRRWDTWNTLAAAAFLILMFRPGDLNDPGFQLSFAAVASIFLFYPGFHRLLMRFRFVHRLRRIPTIGSWLYDGLLVAVCAQIGTLPIIAAQFGRVPTLALPAVVLGAPLIVLIMPLSLIVIAIGFLGIPQAAWLAASVDQMVTLFEKLTTHVSAFSFASLKIGTPNYVVIVALFLSIYLSWHFKNYWARWGLAASLVLLINASVWSSIASKHSAAMEVTYLDVNQGSAALIRFGDGRSLLIDGGPVNPMWDAGERVIIPCLDAYGIDTLDAVIVSHDDSDHIGGLISVMENIPLRNIYWTGSNAGSETYLRFKKILNDRNIEPKPLLAGQLLPGFEALPIYVLHPDSATVADPVDANDASLVIQIRLDQVEFLFPGDIQSHAEKELLRYGDFLQSDVLLIPHHGSSTSSSEAFLDAVDPQIAVISVGRLNPHGHPTPEVIHRLEALPCQIERTDLDGAVVLRTDGHRIWKYDGWK
jgi:competence protein ComEC